MFIFHINKNNSSVLAIAVENSLAQVTVGGVGYQVPLLVPSLIQVICRADPLVMVGVYPVTQL